MAQLNRIIMLHTHLPGVVELDVTGHTNICGTNASGKTTLQRLVPVFYGEQPNRVVPKTRDRFDVFYLPFQNSYLIYEYESAQGTKHVVLTKRADGVDYRFVDAAYQSDWYVQDSPDGLQVLSYTAWAQRLREQGIATSHKISATSEYRAIIQNDLAALKAQRKDMMRLRPLAARFGLVGGTERLRHIEKLVSAVHAKEGKMDTLKSMLATILEEDGYQRPELSFKPLKIRAWIKEMRQFMGIDELQQQYQTIEQYMAETASTQALLWQLKPVLDSERQQLRIRAADAEAELTTLRQQREHNEHDYEQQRGQLSDQLAQTRSQVQQWERDLDQAENRRQHYIDNDIEQLEDDVKSLSLWQQQVDEKARHLALMREQHDGIEEKIGERIAARKLALSENLERLRRKNEAASDAVVAEQQELTTRHRSQIERAQADYQAAREAMQQQGQQRMQALLNEQATLQAKLGVLPLSDSEHAQVEEADARIEAQFSELELAHTRAAEADRASAHAKRLRTECDQQLVRARAQYHQAKQQQQALHTQLSPEHGSLRQYLRDNHPGWQHSLGKLLAQPLLERTDLHPQSSAHELGLQGLSLDLGAISQPEYAMAESDIEARLARAEQETVSAAQRLEQLESELEKATQVVQASDHQLQQAQQQRQRAQHDLDYAKEAKKRLQTAHNQLIKQRQQDSRQRLAEIEHQISQLRDQQTQQLENLRHESKALELELEADYQEQQDKLQSDLALYRRQIDELRADNAKQIRELEKQVNQELAAAGVDADGLQALKREIADLQQRIVVTKERQGLLLEYQDFMQATWARQRPLWLEQLQHGQQQIETVEAQLISLKATRDTSREQLRGEEKALQQTRQQLQQFSDSLEQQLKRFNDLLASQDYSQPDSAAGNLEEKAQFGDTAERIERLTAALNQLQQSMRKLKELCERFSAQLRRNANEGFEQLIEREYATLGEHPRQLDEAKVLGSLLQILTSQRGQIVEQGRNIGGGLQSFFKVFDDVNRKVSQYSRRLTEVVGDELNLEGIQRSEVVISSTVDELGFWQPLKQLSQLYQQWVESGELMPSEAYLDRLAEVADLLRSDQEYSFESLLKLELHLNERGSELIIRNDRQLLESSSHGMAYLILCKFLLAFTRLLRGESNVVVHWPIDEIGTLAYHNVERLFQACDSNQIQVVGAFPNPESDVLLLFRHRYLIEPHAQKPGKGQLKRIQPRVSALSAKLAQKIAATATEEAL